MRMFRILIGILLVYQKILRSTWQQRLQHAVRLKGGLAALTAAIVGVIANLSVWFALHVLFGRVGTVDVGAVRLSVPEWATFDWRAGLLAVVAGLILFVLRWGVFRMLAVLAVSGLILGAM